VQTVLEPRAKLDIYIIISFNTSRVRSPTETQMKRAIMEIVGASTSGGASDTKQPSLLLLDKKTHVFEIA
jgi:hypothetical protein